MKQWTAVAVALALAALAGRAAAEIKVSAEDDLAVVKKAVASPVPARVARAEAAPSRPAVRSGREPQWFKVRVLDKSSGRQRVTVNLPLSLVRALGDETIDWGCHGDADRELDKCHRVRLADVLRTLESGQELVEVDDDEVTVKVWVE